MSKIQQQIFLPASKGLIKSAPSSLIPDGAFSDCLNVRFGDGYVEKVEAFDFLQQFPKVNGNNSAIIKIDLFKQSTGSPLNMVHTSNGLYHQNEPPLEGSPVFTNLFDETDYVYSGGFIDTKVVPNNSVTQRNIRDIYLICSSGNYVYYWDGVSKRCKKLEGLFEPEERQPGTEYKEGDIVRPHDDNGYIYRCQSGGTSGSGEPSWEKNLSRSFSDGTVTWIGIGSLNVEGSSSANVKAKCVEYYKGFTFLANTVEGGTTYNSRLRWSQWQNPRLWHKNEDQSGMAGYVDVDDVDGEIVAIRKLNDILVVYKEKGIIAVTFTGGDTVFSKELITTKTGLVSPDSIVELPHSHIFIGEDDIYEFDGSSITTIGEPIKQYFFNTVNPSNKNKIIGYYDEEKNDVMFVYDNSVRIYEPGLTQEQIDLKSIKENRKLAITFNVPTKTWSKREMYITAIGKFCQTQDLIIDDVKVEIDSMNREIGANYDLKDKIITICGDEEGNVYRLYGQEDSRFNYYGYVTTKTHHMEDPGHIKRLLRIQFHIETTGDCNLVVDIGTGWNSETTMSKWETRTLNLKSPKPPFVDVDLSARYFQIRFGTKNNNEYFKILGYTLYYQTRSEE